MKKSFVNVIILSLGILIGIVLSKYDNPTKAYAGIPQSNAKMNWEYLRQGSDSPGLGYLYRCRMAGGWLVIHDFKNRDGGV